MYSSVWVAGAAVNSLVEALQGSPSRWDGYPGCVLALNVGAKQTEIKVAEHSGLPA